MLVQMKCGCDLYIQNKHEYICMYMLLNTLWSHTLTIKQCCFDWEKIIEFI